MDMRLYYIVRPYKNNENLGLDTDCEYLAGPFKNHQDAWAAKQEVLGPNYYLYGEVDIVSTKLELY